MHLVTKNGASFEIEYGGPVSITENVTFLAKIVNSDVDTVHNTFKNAENTSELKLYLIDSQPPDIFTGYVKYGGFSVEFDDGITVILKKVLGV